MRCGCSPDPHEAGQRGERGQELCWHQSRRFHTQRSWVILPEARWLGSRFSVTFPVTSW